MAVSCLDDCFGGAESDGCFDDCFGGAESRLACQIDMRAHKSEQYSFSVLHTFEKEQLM